MAADKALLEQLANDVQAAVADFNQGDTTSWTRIQSATQKLRRATEPPFVTLNNQRFTLVQNICVAMAFDMGLIAALAASQGKSLSASDLAETTGYDQFLITRVMRMVTSIGFAEETGRQSYTANAVTTFANTPGAKGFFMISHDMMLPLANKMKSYLRENKPCDINQTLPPFDFGMGDNCWSTFRKIPEWRVAFDDAMTMRLKMSTAPWFSKYPLADKLFSSPSTGASPVIVDIGGNSGADLQRLAVAYPSIPCELVLQDLPETIDGIPKDLDGRITPVKYDFFTEQPVKGAEVYYLKSILHDWDDLSSVRILSNAAKAMSTHSRLLIHEMVLADEGETIEKANMDMLMLFMSNGMERTRTHWETLLSQVEPRLQIVNLWSGKGPDPQSVIETALA